MTVTLEREGGVTRIWSDLTGFYLAGKDIEHVYASIIPLIQHCEWNNNGIPLEPIGEFDHEELLTKRTLTLAFKVARIRPPMISIEGKWYRSSEGNHFFLPTIEGGVDAKTFDKIKEDLDGGLL